MHIQSLADNKLSHSKANCLTIFVGSDAKLLSDINLHADLQAIATDAAQHEVLGKEAGSSMVIPVAEKMRTDAHSALQAILLVRLSDTPLSTDKYPAAIQKLATAILALNVDSLALDLAPFATEKSAEQTLLDLTTEVHYKNYRFDDFKSKKKPARALKQVSLGNSALGNAASTVDQGLALAEGLSLTRDLGNMPGNACTPTYLSDCAKKLAESLPLDVDILGEEEMSALGMGSLLSVSAGSVEPAQLIVMKYNGGAQGDAPQVLVGKGITFDTGGISLKPGGSMDEMKYDMCGAASVFGTLLAACKMALPINLIGIVAAAENMPSGIATKPGDVVTSMSGKTIEVLNTDAEGRLVLCDALTYAERFEPAAIIDIATLTGAVIVALGHHASGLYANDDRLANALIDAGDKTHDRLWRLPLWKDYSKQLESNFADLANIGGRAAGSVTAACFLAEFTSKQTWAHLDIAGTAWSSGKAKGASGRPVKLLVEYLKTAAGSAGKANTSAQ